jgi:hypothetical protein
LAPVIKLYPWNTVAKQIKGSEKLALYAMAFGSACAAAFYYYVSSSFPWWVYLTIVLIVAGPSYRTWLEMVSHEKVIDRGDWPTK